MKKKILTLLLLVVSLTTYAQYAIDEEGSRGNLGFGLGISYGGIGARLSFLPIKHIAIFGAGGYNFHGFGYTFGTQVRLLPGKKVVPSLLAMHGYNGVIVVQGMEDYNKTYYGPTAGAGIEIHNRNGQNFIAVELLVPFRSQEFWDRIDELKNNPDITLTGPFPVAFSIGYHLKF